MGETFVKVAVKLLLKTQKEVTNRSAVGRFQYAFEQGGTEQIIHRVRESLREDPAAHAVLVDCSNAFNTIRRKAIHDALATRQDVTPAFDPMTGEMLEDAWRPQQGPLDSLIEGWKQGLEGQTAGSRVMLVIPPELAYPDGSPTLDLDAGRASWRSATGSGELDLDLLVG